jgi:hypothetical protein
MQSPAPAGRTFVVQFTASYSHPDGSERVRVISTARRWAASADSDEVPACQLLLLLCKLVYKGCQPWRPGIKQFFVAVEREEWKFDNVRLV